jgi:HD-GYP domain-containing protein (c-di-GMP phosphodiesterase class II)
MSVVRQKVFVGQLSLGMYVSELDRPWIETPFKLQGFMLRNEEQLLELKALCAFVYVDSEKSIGSVARDKHAHALNNDLSVNKLSSVPPAIYSYTRYQKNTANYSNRSDFYKVAKHVKKVHQVANTALTCVTESLARGEVFDEKPLKLAAIEIVSCVIDNPDVMSWLGRIHENDNYSHDHSIRSATWACVFARYLGVSRADLSILVQAVLLKDVGKMRLPKHLLVKPEMQLNSDELSLYKKYVSLSVALLKQVKGLNPAILPVIQAHRECYDGSGFPNKLLGDEIPLLAIITHIASVYDVMVNPRDDSEQLSPSEAMRELHGFKNSLFQEDLVVDFNQALGMYPPGSVVELNTGAIAVVVEQNERRKLRPIVCVLSNASLLPLKKPKTLNLLSQARAPIHQGGEVDNPALPEIFIVKDVATHACNLDLKPIQKHLFTAKRALFSLRKTS